MRVFVTGATGWVGTHVVQELLGAGHAVLGLARSEEKAQGLRDKGAEAVVGTLDDHDTLRAAAREVDAIAHLAFDHDFSKFAENGAQEGRAVEAMADALKGADTPFLITSGVAMVAPGAVATEADYPTPNPALPRRSDALARQFAEQGLHTAAVRLSPSTHGVGEGHGFVPMLMDLARRTGVSAYIGDGANRWPAVHTLDAARLYRRAVESAPAGQILHGVGDEGVPLREIAEAIGRGTDLPVRSVPDDELADYFGFLAGFITLDDPTSNAKTRELLDWEPTHPGLIDDYAEGHYFA